MLQKGQAARPRLSTETNQAGSPLSTAVTFRLDAVAQADNGFIPFDADYRHAIQGQTSLHRE
jgi:hypothetical protein